MIKDGEERGILTKGKSVLIEPTSGNTGIALTGIGNLLGYKVEIVIPEKMLIFLVFLGAPFMCQPIVVVLNGPVRRS